MEIKIVLIKIFFDLGVSGITLSLVYHESPAKQNLEKNSRAKITPKENKFPTGQGIAQR